MNYIKRLQTQVRALQAEKLAYRDGLNELVTYLNSSKFNCGHELDRYVNTQDVLNRIEDINRHAAGEAVSYGAIFKFLSEEKL